MSSSKDHGDGSVLIPSATNSQIIGNLGVSQDGYPPRVPEYDPPAYSTQPALNVPGTYPNNTNPVYPQDGLQGSYPQQLNQQGFNPTPPQDKNSLWGYPQGEFPQGSPSQVTNPSLPEYNNIYTSSDPKDAEAVIFRTLDFTDKTIRRAFIRKVYGILTCQLLITISFISLFLFHEPTKRWAADNLYMLGVAVIVYFTMALVMICFSEVRRKTPMNFIFLGLFTVATGYMLGVITSTYDVATVMMAACITAAVVLALTLFALQTKYDFTGMGGALLCTLVILLLMGIMWPIMPNRITDILYASIGALIFSFYLIYDTQLMLGGNHKYTISPEEYVFAALQLYLDIINLFIRILYLLKR